MLEPKEGYVVHTISKLEVTKLEGGSEDHCHVFRRKDRKRGAVIDYLSREPLQVYVPINQDVQEELLASYTTTLGGEKFKGLVGAIGRFSLHDLESLFGTMKGELADKETLDDEEVIQARVMAWVPWQGNGKSKEVSETALEEALEAGPEAVLALLKKSGMKII